MKILTWIQFRSVKMVRILKNSKKFAFLSQIRSLDFSSFHFSKHCSKWSKWKWKRNLLCHQEQDKFHFNECELNLVEVCETMWDDHHLWKMAGLDCHLQMHNVGVCFAYQSIPKFSGNEVTFFTLWLYAEISCGGHWSFIH